MFFHCRCAAAGGGLRLQRPEIGRILSMWGSGIVFVVRILEEQIRRARTKEGEVARDREVAKAYDRELQRRDHAASLNLWSESVFCRLGRPRPTYCIMQPCPRHANRLSKLSSKYLETVQDPPRFCLNEKLRFATYLLAWVVLHPPPLRCPRPGRHVGWAVGTLRGLYTRIEAALRGQAVVD